MVQPERLICSSDSVVDGGPGVRFTVTRYGVEEPAFVIRFNGRVFACSTAAGTCRSNSTGSTASSSTIPSYT